MVKDRLAALRAAQDDDDDEVQVNMDTTIFMEEFFKQVDDIRDNVGSIHKFVNEVKKLHSTILAAPTTDDKVKDELEERMAEIKKTAQKVRQKLKVMEAEFSNIEKTQKESLQKYENVDFRIRRIQFSTLSHYFTDTMAQYNSVQIEHRDNCKGRIIRQLEITGKKTDEDEIERMLESGNPQIFTEGILIETKIAKQTLADIEARHKDILKLEQSIKELHDMFMDMAMLVESQGEMIDNIENNMSNTANYVEVAKNETKAAVVYQSKARRKKIIIIALCILLAIILIVILVVLLAAYIPKSSK